MDYFAAINATLASSFIQQLVLFLLGFMFAQFILRLVIASFRDFSPSPRYPVAPVAPPSMDTQYFEELPEADTRHLPDLPDSVAARVRK